jgi:hypothetical protein
MLIGYARILKSDDPGAAVQLRALKDACCERAYEAAASGGRWESA